MDMAFSETDHAFRREVRSFLDEKLPVHIRRNADIGVSASGEDIIYWHKALYEKGWVAQTWPKEWGGTGWSITQRYIWDEECALAGAPRLWNFGLVMCASVLMGFGTEEQKKRYLPRILSTEDIWCQGYSEPAAGSDLASLKTKAELDGDKWVVNGQKIWTTAAHHANKIFCLVRTSQEKKRQEGITFLLIDMKTPGITVRPLITMEGRHEVNEVFFDNVRVPKGNVVGEVGQGWTIAKYLLGHERMGGGSLGVQKSLLHRLKDIARQEPSDGRRPIAEDEIFARELARVEIEMRGLEMAVLRVLSRAAADQEIGPESSIIKIRRTELHQRVSEMVMEAVGYYALPYDKEALLNGWGNREPVGPDYANGAASNYFNNRKHTIFAGSNEIQHNIIAKRVLGL